MTSSTFFIIFIPILAIILLAVNLILAPHNPYQEKDSVFECGFHSFLGQNRTQFSVSFFIFGLLFLLFDLEILLVYPYSVSSYTNDIYGLAIMMIFFVLLTLGFVFELGKNALTIESRQTSFKGADLSDPHAFLTKSLQSNFTSLILKRVILTLFKMLRKYVLTNVFHLLYIKFANNKNILICRNFILLIMNMYEIVKYSLSRINMWFSIKYSYFYSILSYLYGVYSNINTGKGYKYSWYLILLGLFLDSTNLVYSTVIISLCPLMHEYNTKYVYSYSNRLAKVIDILVNIMYFAAIGICMEEIYCGIINPILTYIISTIRIGWNGLLMASGHGQNSPNPGGSSGPSNNNSNPNPGSGDGIKPGLSSDNSNNRKKSVSADSALYGKNYDSFVEAYLKTRRYKSDTNMKYNLPYILDKYRDYLSSEDKQLLTELVNKPPVKIEFNENTTVKEFLLGNKEVHTGSWKNSTHIVDIFNKNSKNIKQKYLGGKNTLESKKFSEELNIYSYNSSQEFNAWKNVWSSQLPKSDEFEKQLRYGNFSVYKIIKNDSKNL